MYCHKTTLVVSVLLTTLILVNCVSWNDDSDGYVRDVSYKGRWKPLFIRLIALYNSKTKLYCFRFLFIRPF